MLTKILWQGKFLDGHLTLTRVEGDANVSRIHFSIESYGCSCAGQLSVDNKTPPNLVVDAVMVEIDTFYRQAVMAERDSNGYFVLH